MKKLATIIFLFFHIVALHAQQQNTEQLAYQYYQNGDFGKAAALLEQHLNSTNSYNNFDLFINALIKSKQLDKAETTVKKAIKLSPEAIRFQISLGKILQEKGKTDEANKIFNAVISKIQPDANAYRDVANRFQNTENFDFAIKTYTNGRRTLNNEFAFSFELINLYRYKRYTAQLINECINLVLSSSDMIFQAQSILSSSLNTSEDFRQLQSALLKKIQKDPENDVLIDLLVWQYIQQKAYNAAFVQLTAQDRRSGKNSAAIYNAANIFFNNGDQTSAIKGFEYLINKGKTDPYFIPAKVQLANAKYDLAVTNKGDTTLIKSLASDFLLLLDEFGISDQTLFALKKFVNLQAYHLNNFSIAEELLERAIKQQNISLNEVAQLKLDLGDIYVVNKQPWEALLVYEQVAKTFENQVVGSEAKFKSAQLSFYQGNFAYAKSQADVLKASTSQLIANDALNLSLLIADNLQNPTDSLALLMYADAELLIFTNKIPEALKKLDSIGINFPQNSLADDILMVKAKIELKNTAYSNAAHLLLQLFADHKESIWIDDAIFKLADLYERKLSNIPEALRFYQELITNHPGSLLTNEARNRFRSLRGDNVGT